VVKDFVKSFAVLHIMGSTLSLNDTVRKACYKAVSIADKAGMIVSFDPNLRAELMEPKLMRAISQPLLKAADIVLPSKQELFDLTGETAVDEASKKMFKHGAENLIIKLGAGGSIALTKQGRVSEPAYDVVESDPTGAGDAFDAAVILGYLRKWTPETILDFANAVGALKVTNVGPMAVPESALEVTEFMKKSRKRT
jgi:sugar/nucleoside kinase (ribokinase family)